jgi:hypothetical protein
MSTLFQTGVRPAIDDYLTKKSQEERDYGEYWSASSAGYCMRLNILRRLKVPKVAEIEEDALRTQRVFEAGHIFHEWAQRITKNTGLSIAQELELQDESMMVRGHIDDLVLVGEGGEPTFEELEHIDEDEEKFMTNILSSTTTRPQTASHLTTRRTRLVITTRCSLAPTCTCSKKVTKSALGYLRSYERAGYSPSLKMICVCVSTSLYGH